MRPAIDSTDRQAISAGVASVARSGLRLRLTRRLVATRCLLALSFLMLAPLFIWFAPDMTRKELTDFVGEKVG